ncbi:MAG: hypothetical protein OHK005_01160 [Candidatus Methylacidiphilales bacterium]
MNAAHCRSRFTAEDFQFVVRTLARSRTDAVSLVELLTDEESRDAVLDHDLLAAELVDACSCVRVSPFFYFYVLTRRVFREKGLSDRVLADYVAAVLVAFSRRQRMPSPGGDEAEAAFLYVSDLIGRLNGADEREAYLQRAFLADYTLFAAGIFAERVKAHAERRGGPDISFYEDIGRASYLAASRHRMAKSLQIHETLGALAERFHEIRRALNYLAENLLHLSPPAPPFVLNPTGT